MLGGNQCKEASTMINMLTCKVDIFWKELSQSEKLYLEFGGKLFGDLHAMRVLPGFDPDAKIKILQELREQAEIIICIYAGDIAENKIREDYGISYEDEVLRMIDEDLKISSIECK